MVSITVSGHMGIHRERIANTNFKKILYIYTYLTNNGINDITASNWMLLFVYPKILFTSTAVAIAQRNKEEHKCLFEAK